MIGAESVSPFLWFVAMVLVAWCAGVAAVTLVVVLIAKWALARADQRDIPRVLGGIAALLRLASWPSELAGVVQALGRPRKTPVLDTETGRATEEGGQTR
jgi:hypothetical protein